MIGQFDSTPQTPIYCQLTSSDPRRVTTELMAWMKAYRMGQHCDVIKCLGHMHPTEGLRYSDRSPRLSVMYPFSSSSTFNPETDVGN